MLEDYKVRQKKIATTNAERDQSNITNEIK